MIRNYFIVFFIYVIPLFCLLLKTNSAYGYEFPPYEGLTLKVEGKVTENYSNNITFAQGEEDKKEQFTTMLLFGLNVTKERKKRFLKFEGQIRQPIRFDESDVRTSSELVTFDFKNEFSKFDTIMINEVYTHTKVPASIEDSSVRDECVSLYERYGIEVSRDDPRCDEFEEEFGRDVGAFDIHENNVNFRYIRLISEHINVITGYGNQIYNSSRESSADSIRNGYTISGNYELSYATALSLSYSFYDTRYEEGDSISTESVRVGLRQYLTRRLIFDGSLGFSFGPSTDTTSGHVFIRTEINELTNASIEFSNDIRSAVDREDIFRNWRVTGHITRLLTEDMNMNASGFYGEGKFVSENVTDSLLGASISLRYIFWEHKRGSNMVGKLGYQYSKSDSTDDERDYDRSSVSSSLTISF